MISSSDRIAIFDFRPTENHTYDELDVLAIKAFRILDFELPKESQKVIFEKFNGFSGALKLVGKIMEMSKLKSYAKLRSYKGIDKDGNDIFDKELEEKIIAKRESTAKTLYKDKTKFIKAVSKQLRKVSDKILQKDQTGVESMRVDIKDGVKSNPLE